MRKFDSLCALGFFAVLSTPALADATDNAAITKLEHNVAETQIVQEALKYYASDAVLYEGNIPDVLRGAAAIKQDFERQTTGVKTMKIDFKELTVDSNGAIGYAYSVQHAAIAKQDGTSIELTFRVTDVLRKRGAKWLIVHEHISYLADPKTGTAIFSKP